MITRTLMVGRLVGSPVHRCEFGQSSIVDLLNAVQKMPSISQPHGAIRETIRAGRTPWTGTTDCCFGNSQSLHGSSGWNSRTTARVASRAGDSVLGSGAHTPRPMRLSGRLLSRL